MINPTAVSGGQATGAAFTTPTNYRELYESRPDLEASSTPTEPAISGVIHEPEYEPTQQPELIDGLPELAPRKRQRNRPCLHLDVFVDDEIAVAQGGLARLQRIRRQLLHINDLVLRPNDAHDEHRKEPASVKKLKQGGRGEIARYLYTYTTRTAAKRAIESLIRRSRLRSGQCNETKIRFTAKQLMSFLVEAWRSLWDSLWAALGFNGKRGTLLLLGLDNAGKTTLLNRLRTGDVRSFPPTDRPHQTEKFTFQGITFQAWDLGGHEAVRHLWEDYVCECSAVIFLIDVSDSARLEEAGFELDALIGERVVENVPVAVLCNKCDLEDAMPSKVIKERIDYANLQKMQGEENIAIFRISVLRGEGYQSAFRWVSKHL